MSEKIKLLIKPWVTRSEAGNKKANPPNSLVVFDVCNTLYFSNTTHDFIIYIFKEDSLSLKKVFFFLLNNRWSPVRYALIIIGLIFKKDIFKKANLGLLKGKAVKDVNLFAERFVEGQLKNKQIPEVWQYLSDLIENGNKIILCSSSIEPIINIIASKLKVHASISTELESQEGIFTGKILNEVGNDKLMRIRSTYPFDTILFAFSDNFGDLPLLKGAKYPIAVAHKEKEIAFWEKNNIPYITIKK